MKNVEEYVTKTLGIDAVLESANKAITGNLPLYLTGDNKFYLLKMLNKTFILLYVKDEQNLPTAGQAEKWMEIIRNSTQLTPILLVDHVPSLLRMRYIERRINFIVPFKQLFLYDLWINLSEEIHKKKVEKEKLIPAAQLLLLNYLLEDKKWSAFTFKRIAVEIGVNSMSVTRAIESLEAHNLCKVAGSRPKFIAFETNKRKLWEQALPFLKSPIIKEVYVDSKPEWLNTKAGESALTEYTMINPPRIPCYAINVLKHRDLIRDKELENENFFDGKFKLQVWYYKENWYRKNNTKMVDPLSLYLSLKDSHDERIQMELVNLIDGIRW